MLAVGIHDVEHLVALVGLHAVVAHLIDNPAAVGRGGSGGDAAHGPEGFGCHAVAFQLDVVLADFHVLCLDGGAGSGQQKKQKPHPQLPVEKAGDEVSA